jgi:AraC-like DNA-binding protein
MVEPATSPHGIRFLPPAPGLEPFVRCYAHRHAHIGDAAVMHPVHARAAPILEFPLADPVVFRPFHGRSDRTSPRAVLIGMQTCPAGRLYIRGTVDTFAILFQPAALERLFSLPAHEFTDRNFEAESVLGCALPGLYQRLGDCRTFEERGRVADLFLLRRALDSGGQDGISLAANQLIRGAGGARIPAMADCAGLSLRQFERRFVQQVGVSPKLFARIARFEAALDRMGRSTGLSWTSVAHRFGYYDQMHMVHEFAEFTGETPTGALRNLEAVFGLRLSGIRSGAGSAGTVADARLIL